MEKTRLLLENILESYRLNIGQSKAISELWAACGVKGNEAHTHEKPIKEPGEVVTQVEALIVTLSEPYLKNQLIKLLRHIPAFAKLTDEEAKKIKELDQKHYDPKTKRLPCTY